MSRTDEGQPMSPYQAMERELPEKHPIDATVERRVPQRKLRRRMRDAGERLMQGLGERRSLWMRLEELLGLYHSRREESLLQPRLRPRRRRGSRRRPARPR